MPARSLAVTALVTGLALTSLAPAQAAARRPAPKPPKPTVVTDAAGDANGANGQGFFLGAPSASTAPANVDSFDIRSVRVVSDKSGTAATKLTATLELAAPPKAGVYRITAELGDCEYVATEVNVDVNGAATYSGLRFCDDASLTGGGAESPVKIQGNKISWTFSIKMLKASGLKVGAVLSNIGAEARGDLVALTVPMLDGLESDRTYKVGQ